MTSKLTLNKKGAVFLTCTAGGGHNSARDALLKKYLEEQGISWADYQSNPAKYSITHLDVTKLTNLEIPLLGTIKTGEFFANRWNRAQKAGDIKTLKNIVNDNWKGEFFSYPMIYNKIKTHLLSLEKEPESFISTQHLCSDAIARAIYEVNKERGWNLKLDLWMTDIPTKYSTHFFISLRHKMAPAIRDLITIHITKPLLQKGMKTEQDFWDKYASGARIITGELPPIRKRFLEQDSLLGQAVDLKLIVHPPILDTATDEVELMRSGLTGTTKSTFEEPEENRVHFPLSRKDKALTLLLGSQPSVPAVLSYLDSMIKLAREKEEKYKIEYQKYLEAHADWFLPDNNNNEPTPPGKYYLFIYSGRPDGKDDLLGDRPNPMLRQIAEKLKDLPVNLNIIPFTFQTDDQLAPLMARSNATLTRSGGLTTMELIHLNRKEKRTTLLHSEAKVDEKQISEMVKVKKKKKEESANLAYSHIKENPILSQHYDHILKEEAIPKLLNREGNVGHEIGNAKYLQKKIGAKIISPSYAEDTLRRDFFTI